MLGKLVAFFFFQKKFPKIFSKSIFLALEHPLKKNHFYILFIFIGAKTTSLYHKSI